MRKTLTVTELLKTESYTNKYGKPATQHSFRAKDEDGGNLEYRTSSETFAKELTVGNSFEAEIEESVKGNYTNRYIRNIFKDGEPVKAEYKPEAKRYGKSPEEIAGMRQGNAMTCIAREHTASIILDPDIEAAYFSLLREALGITAQPMETPTETANASASTTTEPHSLTLEGMLADDDTFKENIKEFMGKLGWKAVDIIRHIKAPPYHSVKLGDLSPQGREALYRELTGMVKNNG